MNSTKLTNLLLIAIIFMLILILDAIKNIQQELNYGIITLIIAVLLFMIWYRLGTINDTYNLLYKYFNEMMLRFEEFNKEDFKVLRYLIYDLDKIMPFIVEKKQYEKRKWDFEEEDRK